MNLPLCKIIKLGGSVLEGCKEMGKFTKIVKFLFLHLAPRGHCCLRRKWLFCGLEGAQKTLLLFCFIGVLTKHNLNSDAS